MQEFCLLFLVFCFLVSSAMIEEKKEDNFSKLSKILVHIIKSCEKNYHAAVINNRTDESVSRHLGGLESVTVNFQDNLLVSIFDDDFTKGKGKINLFITTVENSIGELNKILYDLKFSRWWNILNCYYMCFDSEGKPFIYTFNPYSSRAPHQWKTVEEVSNASYYMAIYNRAYYEDSICKGFNFDRTKYVDKIKIKITIPSRKSDGFKDGLHIIAAMKTTFNVSLTEMSTGCRKSIYFDYLYRMENFTEILWCSVSSDYYFNRYEMLRSSYPTSLEGLYILSSNQRYLSPLEKIHRSFDFSLILGTIIISIITYSVILVTNSDRGYLFTTFEIIRLWIGVSLNTRINSLYLRIFFSLVFIYFLVMQMTLQGDFVDGLSKTKLRKNVNSLSDLRNDYYQKIFKTYDVDIDVFKHENIVKAKIPENSLLDRTCVEKVIKDPSSVCIAYFNALLSELMRKKLSKKTLLSLHLSKYAIITRVRNYLIPDELPLKIKFDKFLMSVVSSGINAKTEANILAGIISNLQTSEYVASFKPISLDFLYFFFIFWFVGITLSLICFFIKILDGSKKYILNCIGDKEIILSV